MSEHIDQLLDSIDVNAKIRELAEQAGCSIDKLGYGEGNLERFAELIVRECTNIVLHYTDVDEGVAVAKSHFGVEE